jgi:hypothetical protein
LLSGKISTFAERKITLGLALLLLAGGGWEGINPCGKASGKYSPHPSPPLQAGEGAFSMNSSISL